MRYLKTFERFQIIIREFYEKGYDIGTYNVQQKIEDEIFKYNTKFKELSYDEREGKIKEFVNFMNKTVLNNFKDYYKDFFDKQMMKIISNHSFEQRNLNISFRNNNEYKTVYYWRYAGLESEGLDNAIKQIKGKLDEYIKPKIKKSIVDNPYSLAPEYSGENIGDELSKRIYDWEKTKTILEKLSQQFLTSDKTGDELFSKLREKNFIDEMIEIMDEVMEKNNYETFHPIKETELKNDFNKFLESYIKYYSKDFQEEQLRSGKININKNIPLEVLMIKLLNMINKNL
jgi:hypothetical protein